MDAAAMSVSDQSDDTGDPRSVEKLTGLLLLFLNQLHCEIMRQIHCEITCLIDLSFTQNTLS